MTKIFISKENYRFSVLYTMTKVFMVISTFLVVNTAVACAHYKIQTRNIGTPLNDSYTVEQKAINIQSAGTRRKIYYDGVINGVVVFLALAILVMVFLRFKRTEPIPAPLKLKN